MPLSDLFSDDGAEPTDNSDEDAEAEPESIEDRLADLVHRGDVHGEHGDGARRAAILLTEAIEQRHTTDDRPDRERSEREIDLERESVLAARDALDSRLAELEHELTAAQNGAAVDFTQLLGSPLNLRHPRKDEINVALEAVLERLETAGELGSGEAFAVYQDAYRGPGRFGTAKAAWKPLRAFGTHPNVKHDPAGGWVVDPDDALQDAHGELRDWVEDELGKRGERNLIVAAMYRVVRDADQPTPTEELAGRLDETESAEEFTSSDCWQGRSPADYLAELPGVEPPEEDAPLFRYVDPDAALDEREKGERP